MKYINLFNTENEHQNYNDLNLCLYSNVSYVKETDKVYYNNRITDKSLIAVYSLSNDNYIQLFDFTVNVFSDDILINGNSIVGNIKQGKYVFPTPPSGYTLTVEYVFNKKTTLPEGAFCRSGDTENIISVYIPRSVVSIGNNCFGGNPLTEIIIEEGVQSIGNDAFKETSISEITIPNSVTNFGTMVFRDCENLKKVILGSGITSIDQNIFTGADNIEDVKLLGSIQNIPIETFANKKNLINCELAEGLQTIENFRGCSKLSTITLPSSVHTIKAYCFRDCTSLQSVIIKNVNRPKLELDSFRNCTSLNSITFYSFPSVSTNYSNIFTSVPTTGTLYYKPTGTVYDSWYDDITDVLGDWEIVNLDEV